MWSNTRTRPSVFTASCLLKHRYNFNEINVSHIQACEFMLPSDRFASRNTPNCHTGIDCKCDRCFEHVQPFYLMGIPTGLRPRRRRNLGFIPGRDKRISFKAFKPALGLTPASYKCVPAAHSPAVKRLKREAELHFRG
jgi:hypothetical protein